MKFSSLRNSYKKTKDNNQILLISNLVLILCLCVSLFFNMIKDTIVISNVAQNGEGLSISSSAMNPEAHQRLGFYLSTQLGNITPASAKYIEAAVLSYISPDIYNRVQEVMALQIKGITQDQITTSFLPERATYENGTTFITGKHSTTGATGIKKQNIKTYEFVIEVQNYTPTISYLTLYDGLPHTDEWREKNKKRAEKSKGNN